MEEEIAALETAIFISLGRTLNLDSGPELVEILYGQKDKGGFELEIENFTKTGEPSTDGEAIQALSKKNPSLLSVRETILHLSTERSLLLT